ncbi:hypothetical protein BC831DRAFT_404638 [Entophlyctis helioformis]|nr:hypothetical protein BC831DRAFT_404638 [Entophlyctis helioformis]
MAGFDFEDGPSVDALGNHQHDDDLAAANDEQLADTTAVDGAQVSQLRDDLDEKMGFPRYREGPDKLGWLINIHPTTVMDTECPTGKAGVDLYFVEEDGATFKATVLHQPYFYVICKPGTESDVEEHLKRKFRRTLVSVVKMIKDDLELPNHIAEQKRTLLKLSFWNVQQLQTVKSALTPLIDRNQSAHSSQQSFEPYAAAGSGTGYRRVGEEGFDGILELREHDVMYYTRVTIDCDIRVGLWYSVRSIAGNIVLESRPEKVQRADPVILAFDIETTKLPLKFPDAEIDSIMMISYMIDGQGYLITNREIVSQDIQDFEYTPKPEFEGHFTIYNAKNEFIEHIQVARPTVFVTYNGDFFDWPFVEARAKVFSINLFREIGFMKDSSGEFKARNAIHMDCFAWVKRDSYLPQGSQNLKAVATYKLGYNPMEIDPEDMTRFAADQPQVLAQYSVSDAVATYYLYMKYVHPFIFSLCNIIPMNPDDVLRRGSGTLCEHLLMVEAVKSNVIMPNKHVERSGRTFEGHLLESETYVGGHVEALEAGVFRSDIPTQFRLAPAAVNQLIQEIDHALTFSITVEGQLSKADVVNYDEVRDTIVKQLVGLRDMPNRCEEPLIYHLDVAAMYPNIILTNRLQPNAVIEEPMCAACDFNEGPGSSCQRRMTWSWRGEYFPASRGEVNMIRNQLEQERLPVSNAHGPMKDESGEALTRAFHELRVSDQNAHLKKRVAEYSRKVYGRVHETKVVERELIVCQREHPFYVDTVRAFRDRRYEYKGLHKTWKKKLEDSVKQNDLAAADEAKRMIVIYDSLQLAHKCILNSFYGYVMRKGARWFSMEMAGIVCLTGARIIQLARTRVEQLGRPLELDTDGIWCILPKSFPENFSFKLANGKTFSISYPCVMLNHLVHAEFTNHQYQNLGPDGAYKMHSENSIFFEVDGPYRAMILPASTEEDKLLKKRYAVFNHDGSLAELKGFEVKRRGELKLIKDFQSSIFKVFLEGSTLQECYTIVGTGANRWLDILHSKGVDLPDAELFEFISENRSMSKSLKDYGAQKSTSITTAKRLAEFLGDQMVKDRGLACKFIISARPQGVPVSERAVPVAIFQADPAVRRHFLRIWLKDNSIQDIDLRSILDWSYYIERFSSVIQKLITIPAAMQSVANPVPRVRHPDWLFRRVAAQEDRFKQRRITDIFSKTDKLDLLERDLAEQQRHAKKRRNGQDMDGADDDSQSDAESVLGERDDDAENNHEQDGHDAAGTNVHYMDDYPQWLQAAKLRWRMRFGQTGKGDRGSSGADKRRGKALTSRGSDPKSLGLSVLGSDRVLAHPKRRLGTSAFSLFGGQGRAAVQANGSAMAELSAASGGAQVLQVVESDIPGSFHMWVLTSAGIQRVRLEVPRRFYMNSRVSSPGELPKHELLRATRCSRSLPRNHACHFLYQLEMPEPFYLENSSLLTALFNHPDVDGVYETQLSLLFRALLQIGCLSSISKPAPGSGVPSSLHLDEIKSDLGLSRTDYLSDRRLLFVYMFHALSGPRHVIGLVFIPTGRCHLLVVDPGSNRDAIPNVGRMYAETIAKDSDSTPSDTAFIYPAQLDVVTSLHDSERDAFAAASQLVRNHLDQRRGATVLAMQSPRSRKYLENSGFVVVREIPVVSVPSHKNDGIFPALGWQMYAVRRMLGHFMHLSDFLDNRVQLARYADVPLCNIENDHPLFLCDLFLARRLVKADAVLWFSMSGKPDLGGVESEDNHYAHDLPVNPEMNKPGAFSMVCVELDVWDLALNTILQSDLIHGLENPMSSSAYAQHQVTAVVTQLDGQSSEDTVQGRQQQPTSLAQSKSGQAAVPMAHSADRNAISPSTFAIFRAMVKNWTEEVRRKNAFASHMLDHLFRWITSPSAKLFDPALFRFIHDLMKRVFWQLVGQLRQLGADVLFASFEKIVISTNKATLANAQGYITYAIASIVKRDIFVHVEVKPARFWHYLMWMDPFNWAGIVWTQSETEMGSLQSTAAEVDMKWSMVERLPRRHQVAFMRIVAEYLEEIRLAGTPSKTAWVEFVAQIIDQKLKRQLMVMVQDFSRTLSVDHYDHALANLESRGAGADPHLEFVKCICAVFGLDEPLESHVRTLKRDLLAILHVNEFSQKAKFAPPSDSLVLHQVICEYCHYCRDLDLTRERPSDLAQADDALNTDAASKDRLATSAPAGFWACSACHMEYDRGLLEQQLVDMVVKRMMAWQLQDVRCSDCRFVLAEDLRSHCPRCTSAITTVQDKSGLLRLLGYLRAIATVHGLEMLSEIVDTLKP